MGAGASHDLSFRMGTRDIGYGTRTGKDFHVEGPLSSGYFYYFNQILKAVDEGHDFHAPFAMSDRLLEYACQKYGIAKNDLLNNRNLSKKVNVENLYIVIETEMDEV